MLTLPLHPCSASPRGRGRALSRITQQRLAEDRATLSVRSHQSQCEVRAADKDAEDRLPGGQGGGTSLKEDMAHLLRHDGVVDLQRQPEIY